MNGHLIRDTPIAVDFWNIRQCGSANVFFLSHIHSDHTVGLTSSWSRPIYCSKVTGELLCEKVGLSEDLIRPLELHNPTLIPLNPSHTEMVTVTAIDANHCPGSIMFLFQGYFGTILYTGDFRYTPQMFVDSPLDGVSVDLLYLDNTYCDPLCVFGSREESKKSIFEIIESYPEHDILLGMHSLGKPDLLISIAKKFNEYIAVPPLMYKYLEILHVPNVFQVDTPEHECRLRVIPAYYISAKLFRRLTRPTIAILTTALYVGLEGTPYSNQNSIYVVPYSDHSSYAELQEFVRCVQPGHVVPIVGREAKGPFNISFAKRADMSVFNQFLTERPLKSFTIPVSVDLRKTRSLGKADVAVSTTKKSRRSQRGTVMRTATSKGVVFESSPQKGKNTINVQKNSAQSPGDSHDLPRSPVKKVVNLDRSNSVVKKSFTPEKTACICVEKPCLAEKATVTMNVSVESIQPNEDCHQTEDEAAFSDRESKTSTDLISKPTGNTTKTCPNDINECCNEQNLISELMGSNSKENFKTVSLTWSNTMNSKSDVGIQINTLNLNYNLDTPTNTSNSNSEVGTRVNTSNSNSEVGTRVNTSNSHSEVGTRVNTSNSHSEVGTRVNTSNSISEAKSKGTISPQKRKNKINVQINSSQSLEDFHNSPGSPVKKAVNPDTSNSGLDKTCTPEKTTRVCVEKKTLKNTSNSNPEVETLSNTSNSNLVLRTLVNTSNSNSEVDTRVNTSSSNSCLSSKINTLNSNHDVSTQANRSCLNTDLDILAKKPTSNPDMEALANIPTLIPDSCTDIQNPYPTTDIDTINNEMTDNNLDFSPLVPGSESRQEPHAEEGVSGDRPLLITVQESAGTSEVAENSEKDTSSTTSSVNSVVYNVQPTFQVVRLKDDAHVQPQMLTKKRKLPSMFAKEFYFPQCKRRCSDLWNADTRKKKVSAKGHSFLSSKQVENGETVVRDIENEACTEHVGATRQYLSARRLSASSLASPTYPSEMSLVFTCSISNYFGRFDIPASTFASCQAIFSDFVKKQRLRYKSETSHLSPVS